jgi:hypothetical protein
MTPEITAQTGIVLEDKERLAASGASLPERKLREGVAERAIVEFPVAWIEQALLDQPGPIDPPAIGGGKELEAKGLMPVPLHELVAAIRSPLKIDDANAQPTGSKPDATGQADR